MRTSAKPKYPTALGARFRIGSRIFHRCHPERRNDLLLDGDTNEVRDDLLRDILENVAKVLQVPRSRRSDRH